jgi:hypothetical protein
MSFVYAEKCQDLIYIIADTYWERPGAGVYDQWKLRPMVKVVILPHSKVAAFVGNSESAEAAFKKLFENSLADAASVLLEANKNSILNGQSVDFILANQNDLSLIEIANGEIQAKQNIYLGSQSAFNLFQRIRGKDSTVEATVDVKFSIFKAPDNVEPASANRYTAALRAFEKTVRELNDNTCGGFPIPVFLTKWQVRFGAYLHAIRAPLSISDSAAGEWATLSLQDALFGGYQMILAGNGDAFSFHYPYGNVGFVYTGFRKNGLYAPKINANDPFDFAYQAESAGCSPSISSWRSTATDRWKIMQLVDAKEWVRAEALIQDSGIQVINHLAEQNPDISFDKSKSLFHNLSLIDEFQSEKEYLDQIAFLLDAELVLRGNMAGEAAANCDWWKSNLETGI